MIKIYKGVLENELKTPFCTKNTLGTKVINRKILSI